MDCRIQWLAMEILPIKADLTIIVNTDSLQLCL